MLLLLMPMPMMVLLHQTQVVSELGEMGHREGEALNKIDSLGYQLANLLDPNMSFDVSACTAAVGRLAPHSLFAFARRSRCRAAS